MPNQIKVEMCKSCKGKGFSTVSGKVCDECKGIGVYGTDGIYDYYLTDDGRGNLRILDVKAELKQPQETQEKRLSPQTQKRSIMKMLFILLFIIFYGGFIGIYVTLIKNPIVFWTITIVTLGFLFLFIFINTNLINKIPSLFTKLIFKEPADFLTAVKERRNDKH